MVQANRKEISGCKAGCGVILYIPSGLFLIVAGLSLLLIAISGVQHVDRVGVLPLDDVMKIALLIVLGLIAILLGVSYLRNAYAFSKRI